jgi:putative aldouronate transport system permease protein
MKEKTGILSICFDIFIYLFFGIFTLVCIIPFYYVFIHSISSNELVSKGLITFIPRGVHFDNYIKIFQLKALPMAIFVTLSRTVLGTFLSVLCTAFVGYAISKRELWHRKFLYRFHIITMYFGAGLIPWYINMQNLHLANNFLAYIIGVISAFNLILVKTYVESVPASLEESAEIDGAGYLAVFFRIMLPVCKPILATIAIFTAVGHWNSFMDNLILMRDPRLNTLQFLLWQYLNEASAIANNIKYSSGAVNVNTTTELTITSIKMTIAMIVTLPVFFIYPVFQKHFVRGIMIGAIKG